MPLIRFVVLAVLAAIVCCSDAHAGTYNVAGNVFTNTLLIKTSVGTGTAFTIDVEGRQYLITAKHMLDGMGPEGPIGIGKFDNHNEVDFETATMKIFRCPGAVDIAVLIPPVQITFGESMVATSTAEFVVGQDAYFVGFPFGMSSNPKINSETSRPFGLVKRGLISGVQYQRADDSDLIILDGLNIFGFSGSPVTYWEAATSTTPARSRVIGVVSGFLPNYGPVMIPKEIKPQEITPKDREEARIVELPERPGHLYRLEEKRVAGKKANEMVLMNTGIVHSYGISSALKLIKLHPIGPVVAVRTGPN